MIYTLRLSPLSKWRGVGGEVKCAFHAGIILVLLGEQPKPLCLIVGGKFLDELLDGAIHHGGCRG